MYIERLTDSTDLYRRSQMTHRISYLDAGAL